METGIKTDIINKAHDYQILTWGLNTSHKTHTATYSPQPENDVPVISKMKGQGYIKNYGSTWLKVNTKIIIDHIMVNVGQTSYQMRIGKYEL